MHPMTQSKLTTTAGYLLIELLESEKTTASGIVIPDTVSGDKPQQGKVLGVGADQGELVSPCKVGDNVVYKKWGGNEYKPSGSDKELMFVKFDDVLAIIK